MRVWIGMHEADVPLVRVTARNSEEDDDDSEAERAERKAARAKAKADRMTGIQNRAEKGKEKAQLEKAKESNLDSGSHAVERESAFSR